jgi:hypothetical protein
MAKKAKRYSSKEIIHLESLARAHTEVALQTICGLCVNGKKEEVRLHAADLLLDRGWGKSAQVQKVIGGDEGDNAIQIVIRDLMAERLAMEKEAAKKK